MFKNHLLAALIALSFFMSACGPAVIVPPDARPLPSPSGPTSSPVDAWNISLDQSGGFAGVQLHVDISSDGRLTAENGRSGKKVTKDLDAATLGKLSALVSAASNLESPRSSCADCFLYDLQVRSAGGSVRVQADDTTLAASGTQDLILLLQQLRDSALKE